MDLTAIAVSILLVAPSSSVEDTTNNAEQITSGKLYESETCQKLADDLNYRYPQVFVWCDEIFYINIMVASTPV